MDRHKLSLYCFFLFVCLFVCLLVFVVEQSTRNVNKVLGKKIVIANQDLGGVLLGLMQKSFFFT